VTLGERIANRRQALGLSQNELARRAGVNHPTLFKIEGGQRLDPSISIVVRIARALGTSAEALLGLDSGDMQFVVESEQTAMAIEIRPLGAESAKKPFRERARAFVTSALERAGANVRDAAVTPAAARATKRRGSPLDAERLATAGVALVDEIASLRRRVETLEAWRRTQEGSPRKRATR
jgi:transcriptional regulator with XRE-family HTH domain